ncbi:MFS transporter [Streptomyces fractus]|uniref:MFS transporter n=1 Tax=Streptomyces fractus TaxID=641806 RepID=UPI003CF04BC4
MPEGMTTDRHCSSRLPFAVWVAVLVVLVSNTQLSLVTPLIPHYVDRFGISPAAAGVFVALHPVASILASVPAGLVVLRVGSRTTVLVAALLAAAASIGLGVSANAAQLFAARFVNGVVGAGIWAAAFAWLVEVAPRSHRGRALSLGMGASAVGGMIGPVIGAAAEATSIIGAFAAIAVLFVILGLLVRRQPSSGSGKQVLAPALFAAMTRPAILPAAVLVSVAGVAFGTVTVVAPLALARFGAGAAFIGATFVCAALAETLISRFAGEVSDRYGYAMPIRIGLLLSAVIASLIVLPDRPLVFAAFVVALMSVVYVFLVPSFALFAVVGDRVGLGQGVAFGLTNITWASGYVVGALLGGVAGTLGVALPGLVIAFLMTLLLFVLRPARLRAE